MSYRLTAIAAAAAIALQGCATTPPALQAGEDLNVGIAKTCSFTPVQPALGSSASSTISMTNDGWCAVRVDEPDGKPFLLGLIVQRPEHGRVLLEKIGGQTRLEYTANPGFTGTDRFTAALRARETGAADTRLQVAVNVSRGESVAATPAPETERPSSSSTTTRRTTRTPARRTTP